MKSKGFKHIVILLVSVLILTSLVGCGSMKEGATEDSTRNETGSAPAQEPAQKEKSYGEEEGEYYDEEQKLDNGSGTDTALSGRKIIQTKYYIIETLTFDKTTTEVEALVDKYLGYLESSQVSGRTLHYEDYYSTRTAYYTMRIPAERLTSFSSDLETLGNVIEESITKEDVTTQLFDVDARIKSLEVQEERLLELLKTGGELKDILEIETQLSDVRYQIEIYKATMNNLENKVSYGTVQLELREVIKETDQAKPAITIGQRISRGFIHSLNDIKDFFVDFFVLIIIALPYLMMWAIFIGIIVFIVKKIITKRKDKKEKKVAVESQKSIEVENESEE